MTATVLFEEYNRIGIGFARFKVPGKGEPRLPALIGANDNFFGMTGLSRDFASEECEAYLRSFLERAEMGDSSPYVDLFPAERSIGIRVLDAEGDTFDVVLTDMSPSEPVFSQEGPTSDLVGQLLDNLQGTVYQIDVNSDDYVFQSGSYEELSGFSKDEFASGKDFVEIVHEEDRPAVRDYDRRLRGEDGFEGTITYRIVTKDGTVKWVKTFDKNYADAFGRRIIQGTIFDITDQKKQEAELMEAYETIRGEMEKNRDRIATADRMEGLATMVSAVSHEVATPLGNGRLLATGMAERAKDFRRGFKNGEVSSEDLMDFLDAVEESGGLVDSTLAQASAILNDFKTMAADQAKLSVRPVNIGEYLRNLQRIIEPKMKFSPHEIHCDFATERTLVTIPGYISQIVQNLVNNALLHAFPGERTGRISITAHDDGESDVLVAVEDNGAGIAEDVRSRMFDMHFTTAEGRGGTGLGLGISRDLAEEKLGGSLDFEQPEGGGARFSLLLRNISNKGEEPS